MVGHPDERPQERGVLRAQLGAELERRAQAARIAPAALRCSRLVQADEGELLNVKADLERELEQLVLDCLKCGQRVHWVPGLGVTAGHWAHREPAPHCEPGCLDTLECFRARDVPFDTHISPD